MTVNRLVLALPDRGSASPSDSEKGLQFSISPDESPKGTNYRHPILKTTENYTEGNSSVYVHSEHLEGCRSYISTIEQDELEKPLNNYPCRDADENGSLQMPIRKIEVIKRTETNEKKEINEDETNEKISPQKTSLEVIIPCPRHVQKPNIMTIPRRNIEVLKPKSSVLKVPKVLRHHKCSIPQKENATTCKLNARMGMKRTKSANVIHQSQGSANHNYSNTIKIQSTIKPTTCFIAEESATILENLSDADEVVVSSAQHPDMTCSKSWASFPTRNINGLRRRQLTSARICSRSSPPSEDRVNGVSGLRSASDMMLVSWSFLHTSCGRTGLQMDKSQNFNKVSFKHIVLRGILLKLLDNANKTSKYSSLNYTVPFTKKYIIQKKLTYKYNDIFVLMICLLNDTLNG